MQLIKEFRAVSPLLSTLDNGLRVLEELTTTTLLATIAPAERAAAESGLADALQNAKEAQDELKRQAQRLEELKLDSAILALAPAVKRLAASSDAMDQYRRDIADAQTDVETEDAQIGALTAQISPELTADEVVKRVPTKTARVTMEKLLRDLERAQQALQDHSQSGWRDEEAEKNAVDELPPFEVKTALRIAEAEVARAHTVLERLSVLPGEIRAAERASAQAFAAANLPDEVTLRGARPLLNGQIDAAQDENHASATRRAELVSRIDQIAGALSDAVRERDQLLAQGAVATRDDVEVARLHRDTGWAFVRATYIDGTSPDTAGYGGEVPLPEAYERAVARADQLIDELAGDQERAARLQSSNAAARALEGDRDALQREIEEIDQQQESRQVAWERTLVGAGLPPLSPLALRDWQALLPGILQLLETLQSKRDELDRVRDVEKGLTAQLRTALLATGLVNPSEAASLSTLTATAHDVAETIKQREEAIQKAAGRGVEREQQRQKHATRQTQLSKDLEIARELLAESFRDLLLPADTDVSVAWARLAEFDDLANTAIRRNAAQAKKRRAVQALAVFVDTAKAIWEPLEDPEPPNLRLYADHLASRLEAAETVQRERALVAQAAESARYRQRNHENTADRHRRALADLCRAAGVESVALLPEAEDRSRRKREGQEAVDRSRTQLAAASRRPVEELRALLAQREPGQMDADELDHTKVLEEIDEELPKARERAEQGRRDLEAIDSSDTAAVAREGMERAASTVRAHMPPWIRSKIAYSLLSEALKRFRERAQGPMLSAASRYFERMTCGEFVRLISDDSGEEPVLIAERRNGPGIKVEEMSEGTRDQLYLALRLAALDLRRSAGIDLPVVLDDVLMASDEERSAAMLEALAEFGGTNQVIVFTHHRHIADLAVQRIPSDKMAFVAL